MADPYAERGNHPAPERLAPDSEIAALVADSGGRVLGSLADATAAPDSTTFAALIVADDGLLPPLARISPELAAALLAAQAGAAGNRELDDEAVAAARALLGTGEPIFLLKDGLVAGPAGKPGAVAADRVPIAAVLATALAGELDWELDPDFGYELVAVCPGLDASEADLLLPRLLYAAADRVYEHAELVAAIKRRRHEGLRRAGVVDAGLMAAIGWPIEPTGSGWKD